MMSNFSVEVDILSTNPNLVNRDARKDIYIKSMGMLDFARFSTLKKYHNTIVSYDDYQYALELTKKIVKVVRAKKNKRIDNLFAYNFIASCADKNSDLIKAMAESDDINAITKSIMEYVMSKLVGFDVKFRRIGKSDRFDEQVHGYVLEDVDYFIKNINRSFE